MPSAEESRVRAPETTVEQDASVPEVVKRGRGRPRTIKVNIPAYNPGEVALQKRATLDADQHLDDVEELDELLADQQKMQCSDWEPIKMQTLSSSVRKL